MAMSHVPSVSQRLLRSTGLAAYVVLLSLACAPVAFAENASNPGKLQPEAPTLKCLGVYWLVAGDDNRNASVAVECRKADAPDGPWKKGLELFRVEKGSTLTLKPSENEWLFAGSIFDLDEGTEYELRLSLKDPDGGDTAKTLKLRTRSEPTAPKGMVERHVVPGDGGGTGTPDDPFKGLDEAVKRAQPGDLFLVHKGSYPADWKVACSGTQDKPIVFRGGVDGEALIEGPEKAVKPPGRGISAGDIHDVWFEKLSVRRVEYAIVAHRSQRIVVRRCHLYDVQYGFTCTNNDKTTEDFFLGDNVVEGPCTWPREKGIENPRGFQVGGRGHVICYNRVRGFADAIDTFHAKPCEAIDIYGNEISECTDDGIEMDYSERNTRCFRNRCTNVFQGISVQPIFGGPVYIFRNAMYNVVLEPFKMHNSPSGALMFHNTTVKKGMPLVLYSGEKVRNCVFRNNVFIGTDAKYAYETTAPMVDCDFDHDAFGGGPFGRFLKWNGKLYETFDDMVKKSPIEKHAVMVDPATAFASGIKQPADEKTQYDIQVNDLRLKEGCAAIDAGAVLPNINDGFQGKAPDIGAFELGEPLPHYGPRPEAK
jgi:hypothetical protein